MWIRIHRQNTDSDSDPQVAEYGSILNSIQPSPPPSPYLGEVLGWEGGGSEAEYAGPALLRQQEDLSQHVLVHVAALAVVSLVKHHHTGGGGRQAH